MAKGIVFIHGYLNSSNSFKPLKTFLTKAWKDDIYQFYSYDYSSNKKISSINQVAKGFVDFLGTDVLKDKLSEYFIIGLNEGGIIASYCMEFGKGVKPTACITLCSPFNGSVFANVMAKIGIKKRALEELQSNSTFLSSLRAKIAKSKNKYYSVYNPMNYASLSGNHEYLTNSNTSFRVAAPFNSMSICSNKTKGFIHGIIQDVDGIGNFSNEYDLFE